MKCENCGKEIDKIVTNFFDIDGSDYEQEIFIEEYDDIVYFDLDRNWCYYELSEDQ